MYNNIQAPSFGGGPAWTTKLHYSLLFISFMYTVNMPRPKISESSFSILPSIIARSEYIVSTCSRHRRFIPEIKRLHQRSKVLAVDLRDQLRVILSRAIGFETAEDMLENSKHSCWSDGTVYEGLILHLGSSYDLCLGIVRQLSKELEIVAKECRALDAIASPDPSNTVCLSHVHYVS